MRATAGALVICVLRSVSLTAPSVPSSGSPVPYMQHATPRTPSCLHAKRSNVCTLTARTARPLSRQRVNIPVPVVKIVEVPVEKVIMRDQVVYYIYIHTYIFIYVLYMPSN
jgi:hypothetical protein